ncbi:hypothetical protein [Thomasclavelia cocleata]|nr:hypothetical protein [Thomasclavelia cocleata]
MEDKIRDLVKEMFDSGMSLDQAIEEFSDIAAEEDFKRCRNESNKK